MSNLIFECTVCKERIADGQGFFGISDEDRSRAYERLEAKKVRSLSREGLTAKEMVENTINGNFLVGLWFMSHYACSDINTLGRYEDVSEIRTREQLISASVRLNGMIWMPFTNWNIFALSLREECAG